MGKHTDFRFKDRRVPRGGELGNGKHAREPRFGTDCVAKASEVAPLCKATPRQEKPRGIVDDRHRIGWVGQERPYALATRRYWLGKTIDAGGRLAVSWTSRGDRRRIAEKGSVLAREWG